MRILYLRQYFNMPAKSVGSLPYVLAWRRVECGRNYVKHTHAFLRFSWGVSHYVSISLSNALASK